MSNRESMRLIARWETGPSVNDWAEVRHDGTCHWVFSATFYGKAKNESWTDQEAIDAEQRTIDGINAKWSARGITMSRVV